MSAIRSATSDIAAAEKEGLKALRCMASKGAYAQPADAIRGLGGDLAVFSPRNRFTQALAIIPAPAFAWLAARGWLEREEGTDRYRLAAAGVKALRQARSGPIHMPNVRQSSKQVKRTGGQGASPMRAAPEGSLAWLRRRRDKDGLPLITEPQFSAGERLGADFWRAQLTPRGLRSADAPSRRRERPARGFH